MTTGPKVEIRRHTHSGPAGVFVDGREIPAVTGYTVKTGPDGRTVTIEIAAGDVLIDDREWSVTVGPHPAR
jgi:hypothetical protein